MDRDSGLRSRPAGNRSRGEVVRLCQGMAHHLTRWTWEEKKHTGGNLLTREQRDREPAGEAAAGPLLSHSERIEENSTVSVMCGMREWLESNKN